MSKSCRKVSIEEVSRVKEIISEANYGLCYSFFANPDKCSNPQFFEDYLKFNSLNDLKSGQGTTYLYIDDIKPGERKIMGYITLRSSSFIKDLGESKKFGFAALEIAELAVSKDYSGQGIGTDMVLDAINIANEINELASIKYIVLCAEKQPSHFTKENLLTKFPICLICFYPNTFCTAASYINFVFSSNNTQRINSNSPSRSSRNSLTVFTAVSAASPTGNR